MKKFKKLIPAMVMLLIATMLMGTTTYAWFSMNTTVTATGMVVKAQASSTLLIDTASSLNSDKRLADGNSTKATLASMAGTGIAPTSTVDGSNWFSAKAQVSSDEAAITDSFEDVTASADNYRLANTFYLQAFDQTKAKSAPYDAFTGKKIVVDAVTVSYTNTDDLASSFRVLVKCGSNKVFVAPTVTEGPTNQGVASVAAGVATKSGITFADVTSIATNKVAVAGTNTVVAANVNYNEVYTVNVYIYFDGEDANCFTDNIPDKLDNYTVTVQFSLVDA